MSVLWTSTDAAAATDGSTDRPWAASGVSIDTRTLVAGDLFVALEGSHRDGHGFVERALLAGAAAAMVRRGDGGHAGPLLEVGDTQLALEALGSAGRRRSSAKVIGVTGSVGKTGTKDALHFVLRRQGRCHASVASYNNHWGVPLSLARLPPDVDYAVLEMGMNHEGELTALTTQARPHVAIITWVASAHLEYFADERAIALAKAEIFLGLDPVGIAILPRDNAHFAILRDRAAACGTERIVTFGTHPDADWRLVDAEYGPSASRGRISSPVGEIRIALGVPGRHALHNALAVLAAADAVGADAARAAGDLRGLQPSAGRGSRLEIECPGGSVLLLDESYNANPASMRAAIELLGLQRGRRLAALGDMRELGDEGARLHAELADVIEAAGVERVYTCGTLAAHLHACLRDELRGRHATTVEALVPGLRAELRAGDVLLVKGSLASGMGRLVAALREEATVS